MDIHGWTYGPKAAWRQKRALRVTKQPLLQETSWPGQTAGSRDLPFWILGNHYGVVNIHSFWNSLKCRSKNIRAPSTGPPSEPREQPPIPCVILFHIFGCSLGWKIKRHFSRWPKVTRHPELRGQRPPAREASHYGVNRKLRCFFSKVNLGLFSKYSIAGWSIILAFAKMSKLVKIWDLAILKLL